MKHRAGWDNDTPEVQPPSDRVVPADRRTVLYTPDGTPLVRVIGFRREPESRKREDRRAD